MAENNPKNLESLLKVLRHPQASDDELCDVAKKVLTFQITNEEVTKNLWDRVAQNSDSPWVREELLAALGSTITESSPLYRLVVELLIKILSSSNESQEARGIAAVSLGVLGIEDSVDILLKILEQELVSNNTGLISSLIISIRTLGNPIAIPALIQALNTGKIVVTVEASQTLGSFGLLAKTALPALQNLVERGTEPEKQAALKAISEIEGSR